MAWRRNTTITRAEWDALTADTERPLTDDPIRLRSPDRPGWNPHRPTLIDQYLAREDTE